MFVKCSAEPRTLNSVVFPVEQFDAHEASMRNSLTPGLFECAVLVSFRTAGAIWRPRAKTHLRASCWSISDLRHLRRTGAANGIPRSISGTEDFPRMADVMVSNADWQKLEVIRALSKNVDLTNNTMQAFHWWLAVQSVRARS